MKMERKGERMTSLKKRRRRRRQEKVYCGCWIDESWNLERGKIFMNYTVSLLVCVDLPLSKRKQTDKIIVWKKQAK